MGGIDFSKENPATNGRLCRSDAGAPFSNNQDIDHVMKMYDLLQEGGTLVAITSKHWVLATEKKCETFRNWLKKVGAERYDILGGSFKESGTSIESVALVIKKLGETTPCYSI